MSLATVVAANVRLIRGRKGWSQEELADRSGIHRTYISGLERGVRNPTLEVIEKLAQALEVDPSKFLENQ